MVVKYVCRNGAIRWGFGKWVVVSSTLIEKYIGLEEMATGKVEGVLSRHAVGLP